jgi:hypothetical protein
MNSSSTGAPSGELDISPGLTHDELWFLQTGNNLVIDVMGTQDSITIANWFGNPSNALNDVATSDNFQIDSGVSQLVQAMATFQANNPGFDPTSSANTIVPNDPSLQSALAAAWHSR